MIEAIQTDLSNADIPENEMFPVDEFGEFRIRLINGDGGGMRDMSGNVIDFTEWVKNRKKGK